MSVHSTHMVHPTISHSSEQLATIRLLHEHGMHTVVRGQDPYSMALITEVYDEHPFTRSLGPMFTIITATGMTFLPYT